VEQLTDYVKSEYAAERMSKIDRSDPKDFSQPFRLTLESAKARRGFTSLTDAEVYIPLDSMFRVLPYDARSRSRPTKKTQRRPIQQRSARSTTYCHSRSP
jgi:hypothetical protein